MTTPKASDAAEIESEAIKRSKRQSSTGNDLLDKAVSWYLRIGFEDGAQFGISLEREKSAKLVEALEHILVGDSHYYPYELAKLALKEYRK